jgi:dihydropyrimidinase
LTDERYDTAPEEAARFVISPPLRGAGQPAALWRGLAKGDIALVATDHVPDRVAVEKQSWSGSFDRISPGSPGIETLLTLVHTEGVARGRITIERMVDLLSTTPARLFGLRSKGAVEVGRDADIVLFDPVAARTIRAADLHHASDYTPYEGRPAVGAVRSTIVRGTFVVRDRAFVGRRGYGRFVERELELEPTSGRSPTS